MQIFFWNFSYHLLQNKILETNLHSHIYQGRLVPLLPHQHQEEGGLHQVVNIVGLHQLIVKMDHLPLDNKVEAVILKGKDIHHNKEVEDKILW